MAWGAWDIVDVAGGPIFAAGRQAAAEELRERRANPPEHYSPSEARVGFGYWDVVAGPLTAPLARGVERGADRAGKLAEEGLPVLLLVGGVLVVVYLWKR